MIKRFIKKSHILIAALILIILGVTFYNSYDKEPYSISKLTDKWIKEVTINNNPAAVAKLFCSDASLVGTVSQVIRTGKNIEGYFKYFAKLPGIKVISKKYTISKIDDNTSVNTAFITWTWDDLKEPIVARMTFIYRGDCIFQLHSSVLPELNKKLLEISGTS